MFIVGTPTKRVHWYMPLLLCNFKQKHACPSSKVHKHYINYHVMTRQSNILLMYKIPRQLSLVVFPIYIVKFHCNEYKYTLFYSKNVLAITASPQMIQMMAKRNWNNFPDLLFFEHGFPHITSFHYMRCFSSKRPLCFPSSTDPQLFSGKPAIATNKIQSPH